MLDADALLASARRPLVVGIEGGGDVVGAFALAEPLRRVNGARPVVGGTTWERTPIDAQPGPRRLEQIAGAVESVGPAALLADADTRVRESGARVAAIALGGGVAGARWLTGPAAALLERAVELVPTEVSAQALRAFRGAGREDDHSWWAAGGRDLGARGAHRLLRPPGRARHRRATGPDSASDPEPGGGQ